MLNVMYIHFNLGLDFSGIVWGITNMAQGAIGLLVGLISGTGALTHPRKNYPKKHQRILSVLYGAIIPCAGATLGFLTLMVFDGDKSSKKFLDGIALFPLIAGIVLMIVFAIARNRKLKKSQ
ncbi:MAG: hypothetical protein ACI9J3_003079 [Parvicellaceae bacterium]|jgi:hypothetical protein